MTIVAAGGLLINLICAGLLHSDRQDDLNMHGAWLHIIGDALGSLGAIIAGRAGCGLWLERGRPGHQHRDWRFDCLELLAPDA